MGDLVDVLSKDLITAQRQNDINDYIEDGTHKVNTLSLDIGGTEVITESRSISGIVNVTATGTGEFSKITIDKTITGAANDNNIILNAISTGTGVNYPLQIWAETQNAGAGPLQAIVAEAQSIGGGDADGGYFVAYDDSNAANIRGVYIEVDKNVAGSIATGLEINSAVLNADTGIKLTGTFTDGINLGANSISNVTNITTTGTITLGSTTLTEQNLIDLLALI